jgi:cell division protein FtsQ
MGAMRHVNRFARHGRGGVRRPPPTRWTTRLQRAAVVLVGLGAVGFAAEALWRSPMAVRLAQQTGDGLIEASADAGFIVTRVYSEGRILADERNLLNALEPYYGRPILGVDLDGLRHAVEGVQWVRSASISRRLPDTLWVRLEEHHPIARWLDGTRQVLVSDAGEVIRAKDTGRFRQLPLLFGAGAPARAAEILNLVAQEPDLASHVTGARLVGERRWDVYLDGRIEVRLPAEKADAAWHRLAAEDRASSLLGRAITAIDLRNPDWLTVRIADDAVKTKEKPGA